MPYNLPPDLLDKELVYKFFWSFSVFECALKREGFLKSQGPNKYATADWGEFGKAISGKFCEVTIDDFQESLQVLESASPKQQIVRNGELAWKTIFKGKKENREQYALRLLKTVRNNLFHGGKYPDGMVESIERNKIILHAALTVLYGCYQIHPGIARRTVDAI